jgi:hypothetical protein
MTYVSIKNGGPCKDENRTDEGLNANDTYYMT